MTNFADRDPLTLSSLADLIERQRRKREEQEAPFGTFGRAVDRGEETFGFRREENLPWGQGLRQRLDVRQIVSMDSADLANFLPQESSKTLASRIKQGLSGGLSLLASAANIIDKPFAATRGILAGDLRQLAFVLPFSESYLKGFYEKTLGIKIPERHITGREVLEAWGAPKDKAASFLSLSDPMDAFFDAAGIALDFLVVPPFLPKIGGLTRYGEEVLRVGKEAAAKSRFLDEAIRYAGQYVASGKPKLTTIPLDDWEKGIREISKRLNLSDEVATRLNNMLGSMPNNARSDWIKRFNMRVSGGAYDSVGRLLSALPEESRYFSAMHGATQNVPSVSLAGVAQELRTGKRAPLILEPVSYWRDILPRIEVGKGLKASETAAKVIEKTAESLPVRYLRALLDWTTKDTAGKLQQYGAQTAIERARNMIAGASDIYVGAQTELAGLADEFAKYHQLATLGNNHVGVHAFEQVLQYITQNAWRYRTTGDVNKQAAEIAKALFSGKEPPVGAVDFVRRVLDSVENNLLTTMNGLNDVLSMHGVDLPRMPKIFADYFPTFNRQTEIGSTGILKAGEAFLTPTELKKTARKANALRYLPGGQITANLAGHDLALARYRPLGDVRYHTPVGKEFVMKDQTGTVWAYGDYVRDREDMNILGRIIGFNKDKVIVANNLERMEVPLEKVVRSAPPPNPLEHVTSVALHADQQDKFMIDWLTASGFEVPEKIAKNPRLLRQYYVTKRYAEPYAVVDPKMMKYFFVDDPASLGKPKEIRNALVEAGLSKREAKRVTNLIIKENGISSDFVRYLGRRTPKSIYSQDVLADHYKYMTYRMDILSAVSGAMEILRRGVRVAARGKPTDPSLLSRAAGTVIGRTPETAAALSLRDAYEMLRIPIRGGRGYKRLALNDSGRETLLNHILNSRPDLAERLAQYRENLPQGVTFLDVASEALEVDPSVVRQAQRLLDVLVPHSEERLAFEKAMRSFLGNVSSWLVMPRAAAHVRNYISNALLGAMAEAPYTPRDFFRALRETTTSMAKGDFDKLEYMDELQRLGILTGHYRIEDVTLRESSSLAGAANLKRRIGTYDIPGVFGLMESVAKPTTLTDAVRELKAPVKEYLSLRAFGQEGDVINPLIRAGQKVFDFVEGSGRAAVYIAARRAGMTPGQAAELVKKTLYDYSRLTGAERRYLQPSIMFYGWLRQNLGYMVPRVIFDWSSGPARMVRAVGRLQRASGQDLPDWLVDIGGVPLWREKDGKTVVLKSLGLPIQDLAMISPHASKTASQLVARTNPVLRSIYVIASGQDPFTGRPIKDVPTPIEKAVGYRYPVGTESVLRSVENSLPGAVFLTYLARSVAGESPWYMRIIDALSGVNVGEYDLDRAVIADAFSRLREHMKAYPGVKEFRQTYATEESHPKAQQLEAILRKLERQTRREKKEIEDVEKVIALPPLPTI